MTGKAKKEDSHLLRRSLTYHRLILLTVMVEVEIQVYSRSEYAGLL